MSLTKETGLKSESLYVVYLFFAFFSRICDWCYSLNRFCLGFIIDIFKNDLVIIIFLLKSSDIFIIDTSTGHWFEISNTVSYYKWYMYYRYLRHQKSHVSSQYLSCGIYSDPPHLSIIQTRISPLTIKLWDICK